MDPSTWPTLTSEQSVCGQKHAQARAAQPGWAGGRRQCLVRLRVRPPAGLRQPTSSNLSLSARSSQSSNKLFPRPCPGPGSHRSIRRLCFGFHFGGRQLSSTSLGLPLVVACKAMEMLRLEGQGFRLGSRARAVVACASC